MKDWSKFSTFARKGTGYCTFLQTSSCFVLKGQAQDIFESQVLGNRNTEPKVAKIILISVAYVTASYIIYCLFAEKRDGYQS